MTAPLTQLKQVITEITGQSNTITIPRTFIEYTGDMGAAAMLNQVIFWSGKKQDQGGWFYKSTKEWQQEICLTRYQVNRCIGILSPLGVEVKVKRANGAPTRHYRITEKFYEEFTKFLELRSDGRVDLQETSKSDLQETSKSDLQETSKSITDDHSYDHLTDDSIHFANVPNGNSQRGEKTPEVVSACEDCTVCHEATAVEGGLCANCRRMEEEKVLLSGKVLEGAKAPNPPVPPPPLSPQPAPTPIPAGYVGTVCAGDNFQQHLCKPGATKPICKVVPFRYPYPASLPSELARPICAECARIAAEPPTPKQSKPKAEPKPESALTLAMHNSTPEDLRPVRCHYGKHADDAKAVLAAGFTAEQVGEYVRWYYATPNCWHKVNRQPVSMAFVSKHIKADWAKVNPPEPDFNAPAKDFFADTDWGW